MGKGFKDKKPTDFNRGASTTVPEAPATAIETVEPKTSKTRPKAVKKAEQEKRKPGRPPVDANGRLKAEYTRKVNIAIPNDVMDNVAIAAKCHGGTITDYINRLIIKDLSDNLTTYKNMFDMINNL